MSETAASADPKSFQPVLIQALDALNRNELVAAETALDQVLRAIPDEPDALQLLGLVRRAQNRPGDAEALYRQSLAARPAQPNVHHNLGNLLFAMGRSEEAAACQREAVRLKPNYVEAHYQLGLALHRLQQFDEAVAAFRTALRYQPNYMFGLQAMAASLSEGGKPKEAEAVLRRALQMGSKNPRQIAALQHNLGVALRMQRRYGEALALLDQAQAAVPDMPLADYNRAVTFEEMHRPDEAIYFYQQAIARDPLNVKAHHAMNQLLYRYGRDTEFLKSYDDAALLYPDQGALPLDKAMFLFFTSRFDEAREHFERAEKLLPDHVTPLTGLGMVHARQGDFGKAIDWHEKAAKLEPENSGAWTNFSETLIRAGEHKRAVQAAEEALAINPDNQYTLALWGTALRALNDGREEVLNDYESMVQAFDIEPPEGYSDIESFNRDLDTYLDRLHADKREYLAQSLRGGTQTPEDIFGKGHVLVDKLQERIDEAVARYIAGMKDDAEHPLFKRRRAGFSYTGSWSVRLRDCGFHANHVHPKGWISSAYYIALPETVADAQKKEGWIKFGEPDFDAPYPDAVKRAIQPRPGRLVLFPSYMWHGTIPFHSPANRTTIAFDAVPK